MKTQGMIRACVLLIVFSNSAVGQDSQDDSHSKDVHSTVTRLMEICRAVADRHVEPPAMQQLVLSAARSVYSSRKADAPRDLGQRISKLTTDEQFKTLLNSVVGEEDRIETDTVVEYFLTRIPGGGRLIEANDAQVEAQVSANKYVGVGIALGMQADRPHISVCFYGGPGYEAGVKSNDTILAIDGESTEGQSLSEVVKKLRGDAGTDVTLLLKHPTVGERKIVVTRNVAFIPTVTGASQDAEGKWIYRLPSNPDVAVFRIDRFGASTAHEFKKLNESLSDKELAGIILDLRAGGGDLHNVVMVADQFLDAGIIGSTKIGEVQRTYKSQDDRLFDDIPMVVLTSSTASASSTFLAAALQDRGRAVVVGEPTFGVSYVRSQVDLKNGDKLIIPSGYVRRGNGTVLFSRYNQFQDLIAADRMQDATFDRRSSKVVFPDYLVFADRNRPSIQAAPNAVKTKPNKYEDQILNKAVSVLKQPGLVSKR